MATYFIPTQQLPVLRACRAFTQFNPRVKLHTVKTTEAAHNATYRHPDCIRWTPNYQPKLGDVFIYRDLDHDDSYINATVVEAGRTNSYEEGASDEYIR